LRGPSTWPSRPAPIEVCPLTTVTSVEPLPGGDGGSAIETRCTSKRRKTRKFTAKQIAQTRSRLRSTSPVFARPLA
jgi:hypothetical protein